MKSEDDCAYPKCRNESILTWLGTPICGKHWEWVCTVPKEKALEKLKKKR